MASGSSLVENSTDDPKIEGFHTKTAQQDKEKTFKTKMTTGVCTVVKHTTNDPWIEGLNPEIKMFLDYHCPQQHIGRALYQYPKIQGQNPEIS